MHIPFYDPSLGLSDLMTWVAVLVAALVGVGAFKLLVRTLDPNPGSASADAKLRKRYAAGILSFQDYVRAKKLPPAN